MPTLTLQAAPYRPSIPLSGGENSSIYRGKNAKLRGNYPNMFYEVYGGSENLNEPIPALAITGTIAFTADGTIVTGTATTFQDELHIGQKLLAANGEVLVVAEIFSSTSFKNARPLQTTATGQTADRLPRLFPLDIYRGSQIWGNAVIFDKGTICSVGSGTLYKNGAVLPGTSLTATRRAQIAIYDAVANTYAVEPLGFDGADVPVSPTVTIIGSGGSKNMPLGYYSFRVGYYSDTTTGYGNPGDVILGASNAPFQLTAANSQWSLDFTSDVATRPSDADGYVIYKSAFSNSSDQSKVNAIDGGWFECKRVLFTDLVAEVCVFEAIDSDLTTLVSFDNARPPDAEFITTWGNYNILISTNGKGVNDAVDTERQITTSPGAFVSPQKADNPEGYPNTLKVPTEKGENIIGFVTLSGRIFVLTANKLQAVSYTGLPSAPFDCRAFWERGFVSPDNVCAIGDTLYIFSTSGIFRSIGTGDTSNEQYQFATDVKEVTSQMVSGYTDVKFDPKNQEVCFIYAASRKNDDGYWESDILPLSLEQGVWNPPIVLSDPTRDMIVTGAATVNGYLEYICGGRRASTTNQYDTWRYDTGSGQTISGYLAWNFVDNGAETVSKVIRSLRPKGKFADAKLQIYATTPDSDVEVTDLENGTNPAFEIDLDATTAIHQYQVIKAKVKNALMWTLRLEFTSNWSGTGKKDQIHEVAVGLDVAGQQR